MQKESLLKTEIPSKIKAKDWQKLKIKKDGQMPLPQKEKKWNEIQNIGQQLERTQARIDAIQEEHGSNLESETELNRIKEQKKNYQTELESKKKEVAAL